MNLSINIRFCHGDDLRKDRCLAELIKRLAIIINKYKMYCVLNKSSFEGEIIVFSAYVLYRLKYTILGFLAILSYELFQNIKSLTLE